MANYLPVLLVSANSNSIPDDSAVCTLPRGQVDYLSHNWEEEDVWRSWRNMTRQKNEIANGIRLENASWRTWWKQRNKLKTVTPETLNWLKDSDVTWLYGPLHTAVDWTPPPKSKPVPMSVDDKKSVSAHDRLDLNVGSSGMKPILKHRTISELLMSDLPLSPISSSPGSDTERGDDDEEDVWVQDVAEEDTGLKSLSHRHERKRPPLLHTKSDTHLTRLPIRSFGRGSPPRITTEGSTSAPLTSESTTSRSSYIMDRKSSQPSLTSGSDQDTSSSLGTNGHGKKKHISFNTFVEQCIAVEKPKSSHDGSSFGSGTPRHSSSRIYDSGYDDGYDEDTESTPIEEEEEDDDVLFNSSPPEHDHFDSHSNSDSDDDDDEDDDEVLEIRTTSIRQRASPGRSSSSSSSSGSSRSPSAGGAKRYNASTHTSTTRGFRYGPALLRTPSVEKEHVTILPIAPTILKTKGVGNGEGADDDYEYPISARDGGFYGAGTNVPVHLVYVPPLGSNYCMDSSDLQTGADVYRHREAYFSVGTGRGMNASAPSVGAKPSTGQEKVFYHTPLATSPTVGDGAEEDAYDYFEGPDMGIAFADRRTHSQRTEGLELRNDDVAKVGGPNMVKFAEGGAASVSARSSGTPQVVIKGVNGALQEGRERSRSRSRSKSRTPSPGEFSTPSNATIPPASPAVAVPRVASSHLIDQLPTSSNSSSLLSPPDVAPSRGRSSTPLSENQPRGRSATRNSSFSDRERSSSRGTSSPIGSISPEGSAVGIAIGSAYGVYANGRDRESSSRRGKGERGRIGRRDHAASADDVRTSLGRLGDGRRVASNSPTSSGSSTVSATSTAVPTHGSSPLRISIDSSELDSAMSTPMPTPTPKGLQAEQLRHPPPLNPPVSSIKHTVHVPPPLPSSPSTTVPYSPKGFVGPSGSPTSARPSEDGTLVGRAADMVSSAGAFLGSIWQGNVRT